MLRRVRFYNVGKADYNFIKKEELVVYKHFRGESLSEKQYIWLGLKEGNKAPHVYSEWSRYVRKKHKSKSKSELVDFSSYLEYMEDYVSMVISVSNLFYDGVIIGVGITAIFNGIGFSYSSGVAYWVSSVVVLLVVSVILVGVLWALHSYNSKKRIIKMFYKDYRRIIDSLIDKK
ncbi:hypothetical protein [Faecalicatena contorta]|uniref:Uncharacterized protein n=1 Tax=Faecalicatena contorta TaxID=39482 RepID=A0A315ZZZ3_9FIRM|nr:hypothetical protein [Faecalicatena contorta]PWJ50508.1 hypothetical protein A8805_104228 [Faecalicatena contorta]SUQ13916.1 hypothetical protein SAMN05216529_104228 [Faecalicatena contorta]